MISSVKSAAVALTLTASVVSGTMLPEAFGSNAIDPHAHHHTVQTSKTANRAVRSVADYRLPEIPLIRADGKSVLLAQALGDGRPIALNFIFTTCTAICPVTSLIFSELQSMLDPSRDKVQLVSISIDPQQDTPAVLSAYAKKYGAGKDWHFYTGTTEASIAAQQAFNVYRGDKMNHTPVTLLRSAPGKAWIRLEGFVTADDLLQEIRRNTVSN